MSGQVRFMGPRAVASAVLFALLTSGCDSWQNPLGPEEASSIVSETPSFARVGRPAVALCHRSNGEEGYIRITVADRAVPAHLRHGDALVGDPVPGQPEMEFDAACRADASRRVVTVTGSWNGTSYLFSGLFTVESTGPVDATATVSATDPTWPLHFGLLGYDPQAPNPPGTCSTLWLPTALPAGPTMNPPTIEAHWDAVPPGTYCLNVASSTPVPPYPPPYTWTATIIYP